MKLLTIRALRGPSIYHTKPCILMKVDLEEMEEQPSNLLPEFRTRLEPINSAPSTMVSVPFPSTSTRPSGDTMNAVSSSTPNPSI